MMQAEPEITKKRRRLLPVAAGAVVLLLATAWAADYFSAEARVRRATLRVVRLAEKPGEESPVVLGLATHRLGGMLATNAVLELEGAGVLATGRREILQLFSRVRASMAQVAFEEPRVRTRALPGGEVRARVEAVYRLIPATGPAEEGDGVCILLWSKGEEGWAIRSTVLRAGENLEFPAGLR